MKKQNIIICKKYLDKYQNVVEIFENEKSIKKAITINNIAFKKNIKTQQTIIIT